MTQTVTRISVVTLALTLLLAGVSVASAAETFSGEVGTVSDGDATGDTYYLRQSGDPAPVGYSHVYQWAAPRMVCDPNNTPVVFTGTVDMNDMVEGDVAMIGLVDENLLANGYEGWFSGAYVYVHKDSPVSMRIGPSDGFDGGEIVQVFGFYSIPEDGIVDIVMTIYDGEISVDLLDGFGPYVDTYGELKSSNNAEASGYYEEEEFHMGAVVGWDSYPDSTMMPYDFSVEGCTVPFVRTAEITSPEADSIQIGVVDLEATLNDDDTDDNVQWAVREGTCAAGTNTVAGNVDGKNDPFSWDGETFSADWDSSEAIPGQYCFIFNPTEGAGEDNIRETQEFYVESADADGDGVDTDDDYCPNTVTDEFPGFEDKQAKNRWALGDDFTWVVSDQKGTQGGFAPTMDETKGCSGAQILDIMSALIPEEDFGGHYQYGLSKGLLEAWIAGEYYVGPTYLETVAVPVDGSSASSLASLGDGTDYWLDASGTYRFADWGEYGIADAEWAYRRAENTPDNVAGWVKGEGYYASECGLDIQVDGSCVDWGDLSGTNEYTLEYVGTGAPASFHIYDSSYGDNGESDLAVDIIEDKWVDLW